MDNQTPQSAHKMFGGAAAAFLASIIVPFAADYLGFAADDAMQLQGAIEVVINAILITILVAIGVYKAPRNRDL